MRVYKTLSLSLIAGLCMAFVQPSEPITLRELFTPDGCDTICWQELEIGVTTLGEAKQSFENQNIQYEIGMLAVPDDSWVWKLENVSTLIDQDQQITVLTEFYKEIV